MPEFVSFGKIARLNRDITITEKIDGTNAAIGIDDDFNVWAQSRTRIIVPGDDNFGFAAWVDKHRTQLATALGPGLHFGEWWGVGIQRGYGLTERRFSLFNTKRWGEGEGAERLTQLQVAGIAVYSVPVLYEGGWIAPYGSDFDELFAPMVELNELRTAGSRAVPGYMNPEGIIVYHKASNMLFKATCEKDEAHKTALKEVA